VDFLIVLVEHFARCYGWGATSEYWLEIGVFEGSWSVSVKFSRRERPPRTIFARIDRPVNAHYNFAADNIHTKKLCSRLSSSEVQFYTENRRFPFLSPPPLRWALGPSQDFPLGDHRSWAPKARSRIEAPKAPRGVGRGRAYLRSTEHFWWREQSQQSRLFPLKIDSIDDWGAWPPCPLWIRPRGGGFGATYDVHLRLIGTCVVDFLLVLIDIFR